ncbi:MAG: hypothetical protein ACYDCC_05480 [Actinomycetota bacterium]
MSKHLKLGNDPSTPAWTLANDADVVLVQKEIAEAMMQGKTVRVRVLLSNGDAGEMLINGSVLEAALAWDTDFSQPTLTIID